MHELQLPQKEARYELTLIINMELSKQSTIYRKYFNELYNTSDIIIHESPYLLGYDQYLGLDNKPRFYNSHNHEYVLANQTWRNDKARKYLSYVYKLEKKLTEVAKLVFATSELERDNMIAMFRINPNKVKLAPNGVYPEQWQHNRKIFNIKPMAIFIGSEYPPNIEAVNFIIHHLADECPEIEFIIVGGCCNPFFNNRKSNVKLLGRVQHKQKLKLFANADIAINPMFSGAGVNLKTLEFLSAGLPLFSTHFGIRGLNLNNNEHYIQAQKEDFAEKINHYYHDKIYLKEVSLRGQKHINDNYSWRSIAKSIADELEKCISF